MTEPVSDPVSDPVLDNQGPVLDNQGPVLPPFVSSIAARMAVEGIPVAAIARVLLWPGEDVSRSLKHSLACGMICDLPAYDWPPTARHADRLPTIPVSKSNDDTFVFQCRRLWGLTGLQAAFFYVLMKNVNVDKAKLHNVVEKQRALKGDQVATADETDPKMVDVVICHLRKRLRKHNIKISTLWGFGYFIDEKTKSSVKAILSTVDPFAGETEHDKTEHDKTERGAYVPAPSPATPSPAA